MTAIGQLQHHFGGSYAATIVLRFESEMDASIALAHAFTSPSWCLHPERPNVLVFHGSGHELEHALCLLAQHGADRNNVQSVAKSIDYGERFTITIHGLYQAFMDACRQQPSAFELETVSV
jgi:hypothetical protein